MNTEQLIYEINRLYEVYEIDKNQLNALSKEQMVKETKGLLATLDKYKVKSYTNNDLEVIREIYFFFC
jgi:hypothetical protein